MNRHNRVLSLRTGCLFTWMLAAIVVPTGFARAAHGAEQPPRNTSAAASGANEPAPSAAAQPPVESLNPARPKPFPGSGLANDAATFFASVKVDHVNGIYKQGDTLTAEFVSEQAGYLYLLYHQADGVTKLLLPNAAHRDNRVEPKQVISVPAPGEAFRIRVKAPLGTEVLQVLAATQPVAELDALGQAADRAAVVPAETLAALASRVQADPTLWAEQRTFLQTAPGVELAANRKPCRTGLFIGIGKYADERICKPHEELRHSAEVLHRLMLDRGQLDPQRTKLVVDEDATKANLKALITEWLPSVSQPGDTVFVYFAGHSGQNPTGDPTEPDGRDETLAPYDLTIGADSLPQEQRMALLRESNITDDMLAHWFQALAGRQIALILDTCHAQGVVDRKSFVAGFGDEAARVKDLSQQNMVILASCAADEGSRFEATPDKTCWFTYFLAQAIQDGLLPRPLTVQQAHQYAAAGLREALARMGAAHAQSPAITDTALLPVVLVP